MDKRSLCKLNEKMKRGIKSHIFDLHEKSFSSHFGRNKEIEKFLYTHILPMIIV